jgi:beta-lactamase superfamily II metal-dependent hydrolase
MTRRQLLIAGLAALLLPAAASAQEKGLDIFFIDVEGGAATLVVTPAGESILTDSGWDKPRDADRILRACKLAGVSRIDHHIITHWHADHFGSTLRLLQKSKIGKIYHHGVPEKLGEGKAAAKLLDAWKTAAGDIFHVVKAGDDFPLQQASGRPALKMRIVAADGKVAGRNAEPGCKDHPAKAPDKSDNANSVAALLSFGDFKFLNCGDLTWNIEHMLVCPENSLGTVDVYMVAHHGGDTSNNPAVLRAIQPRVSVMCNGPAKGGAPATVALLKTIPSLQANYQLHRRILGRAEENTAPELIANKTEEADCVGEFIRLTVAPDGKSYTVTIGEKGTPRRFETK